MIERALARGTIIAHVTHIEGAFAGRPPPHGFGGHSIA